MPSRATAAPVAVATLVLVTVSLGAGVTWLGTAAPAEPPPRVALGLSVDGETDTVALTHRAGDALDVRRLRLRITVDGDPLVHQPPVPFFAATGFESGPTGPFNRAADPRWDPGETAAIRIAGTNAPAVDPGAEVRAEVFVGDYRVVLLTTTAA